MLLGAQYISTAALKCLDLVSLAMPVAILRAQCEDLVSFFFVSNYGHGTYEAGHIPIESRRREDSAMHILKLVVIPKEKLLEPFAVGYGNFGFGIPPMNPTEVYIF